jgi:hypothetical protein
VHQCAGVCVPIGGVIAFHSARCHSLAAVRFLLEQFLMFGVLSCLDTFLHNFTLVPLRFLRALVVIVTRIFW